MIINLEYRNKIRKVKNHFGIEAQSAYIWNEIQELDTELRNKCGYRNQEQRKKIASEIADCYFMGLQIGRGRLVRKLIVGLCKHIFWDWDIEMLGDIENEIQFKIDRTLERIKDGYYSKPEKCPECNGKGKIRMPYTTTMAICKKCKGSGSVKKGVVGYEKDNSKK